MMTKVCYFECYSGASGDMLLGALLGTGINQKWFINELKKLNDIKDSFEIKISNTVKKGITATNAEIILTVHDHHHRGLDDIISIINSSDIDGNAKTLAIKIFTNLGKAEAKVHNTDINKIHFHEVGAIDSIVDIVGFSILFTSLNINKVIVSPVNTGTGFIECAHGVMPIPAPATLELLQSSGWPVNNSIKIESELLTPTGAAILSTIKDEFQAFPSFEKITSISYGAGNKDLSQISNTIRLTIGESESNKENQVWIVEANIDDMQPEIYDYIFDRLLDSGALDVFLTPIIMKKSRPANILSVICDESTKHKLEQIIFEETTTFGIRYYRADRTILSREFKKITLPDLGEITIKIGKDSSGKILSVKPEYKDCTALAKANNLPLKSIYRIVDDYLQTNKLKQL